MGNLLNKAALITGASKGIGKAIALALAVEGYDLALCARNMEGLEDVEREIQRKNPSVRVFLKSCDFSSQNQLEELADWVEEQFPVLDVLVNNVGYYHRKSLLDEAPDVLSESMQINLNTAHYLSVHFGRIMRGAKKGHIVSISSIASRDPVKEAGSYTITKFAMAGLTQVLREELRDSGVKVTEIIPSSTLTSSWEGTGISADKFIWPEDIAKTIVLCLSMSKGANIDEVVIKPVKPI